MIAFDIDIFCSGSVKFHSFKPWEYNSSETKGFEVIRKLNNSFFFTGNSKEDEKPQCAEVCRKVIG